MVNSSLIYSVFKILPGQLFDLYSSSTCFRAVFTFLILKSFSFLGCVR